MKIGLIGWGVEAKSAYEYFGPEHQYVICNEEPRNDFPSGDNVEVHFIESDRTPGLTGNVTNLSYLDYVADCDQIIVTVSAQKNIEKHFASDNPIWLKIKTVQHIFFENTPTKNIIGVTGTKGKGTTTSLIAELLKASGKDVYVGGNIGIAVLDLLPHLTPESWVVLELSSFQLYRFPFSPHIAVHLMMVPEHIEEWHKTMKDYVDAKRNIFANQTANDIAIFLPTNEFSRANAESSPGVHIPYGEKPGAFLNTQGFIEIDAQPIVRRNEIALIGEHNIQNICAAVTAAWQVVQDVQAFACVLREFKGLEHRLQFVRELDGVRYFDDSFGTVPNTAQVAVDAFTEPKILILGGHDKGNDWTDMVNRLKADDIRHIVLIGTITQRLYGLMQDAGVDMQKVTYRDQGNSWTMLSIIDTARQHAKPGDVVLLSTGCASFGLFKDYKDRGNQFAEVVTALRPASTQQ